MSSPRLLVAAVLLVPFFDPLVLGQRSSPESVWWKGTFEEARAEARVRNVPLLICFNQDGEEASERALALYESKEWRNVARRAVTLICSPEKHDERLEGGTGRKAVRVCSRFGHASCQQHRDVERAARVFCWGAIDAQVSCPSHFVMLPDGKEIWRDATDVPDCGLVVGALRDAQSQMGRGLDAEAVKEVRSALASARTALQARRLGSACDALERSVRTVKGTSFAKEHQALMKELEGQVKEQLAWARGRADKDLLGAMRRVQSLDDKLGKSPWSREIRSLLRELRGAPEGREVARILKEERRVIPLLEKARRYDEKGEFSQAAKTYAKVVERAPGSLPAGEALSRLEALAADRDIGALVKETLRELKAELAYEAAKELRKKDRARGDAALEAVVETYAGTKAARSAERLLRR